MSNEIALSLGAAVGSTRSRTFNVRVLAQLFDIVVCS
jgi:hypothetical protein